MILRVLTAGMLAAGLGLPGGPALATPASPAPAPAAGVGGGLERLPGLPVAGLRADVVGPEHRSGSLAAGLGVGAGVGGDPERPSDSLRAGQRGGPAEAPVSLVVGLRADVGGGPVSSVAGLRVATDVVGALERRVDVVGREPLSGAVAVEVPADQVAVAAAALRADPAVAYVEPDHVARIAAVTPNDPAFRHQWGITRTRVDTAWRATHGAGRIVVAVVDTGVRKLPDLAGRLLPGRDFVNDDSNADDDQGHGTMAAGVIAAAGGNRIGVAGICWRCKILPVKVLNSRGYGSYSDIAEGVRWSADRGADIINLSLGGASDSRLLRDAVAYATGKGALVIAAAGNDGSRKLHYPAAIPDVLAVGASTDKDTRYSWSNYGSRWVDIAAPGCNPAQGRNSVVARFCGTSSATPFVAGVAALLASARPAPTAAMIRRALTSSADRLAGKWVAHGRVDAAGALAALPVVSFVSPGGAASVRGTVTVTARVAAGAGVTRVELLADGRVVGTDRAAPYRFRWRTAGRGATVTLQLRAHKGDGDIVTATRRVTTAN
jgi:thermitase